MAVRTEKTAAGEDIVISGFEQGISLSPHKGIANIQNANISTESGEVMASFARQQQTLTNTTATGSLTFADSSHVNLSIANTNNLFKGNWITVTGSSNTTQLPNGTYYVPPSTGSAFQLANYYNAMNFTPATVTVSALVVGAGGGSGGTLSASGAGGGGGGGQVLPVASTTVGINAFLITVGTGGVGGGSSASTDGVNGNSSIFNGNTAIGGGGGGHGAATAGNGLVGASGGGGGSATNNSRGTGGTGSAGNKGADGQGGSGSSWQAGGGGGSGSATTGINGGTGTANSISGTSVSYAGGGGGGAIGGATPGTAGSTGPGTGGTSSNGLDGIVIISYPTGSLTATGGTITTSGGNTIHTFTTTGTWTVTSIPSVTVPPVLTGFTAGLTASFTMVATIGKPIAQATEQYYASGVSYHRYYVLDANNLVWVYDEQNEILFSSSDNVNWFLPDYVANYATRASGIGVISGFLMVATEHGMFGKPVVALGNTNTQTTTWVQFPDFTGWQGSSHYINTPHFCFVGHQGIIYITDASYIVSIFPDATISDSTGQATADNVQTLCSWTNNVGDPTHTGDLSIISGTTPVTSDGKRLPVVFFTVNNGILPNAITAGTVYYIQSSILSFNVFPDASVPSQQNLVLTSSLSAGNTSATLTAAFPYKTGTYQVLFSNAQQLAVSFTSGSTAISWTTPIIGTATVNIVVFSELDIQTGASGTQYFNSFYPIASASDSAGATPLEVLTGQRLTLPDFEVAQCMAEIGNQILVGCASSVVYPWDQVQNLPQGLINLPESNTVNIITVNQMGYIFTGNKANIYITDGGQSSQVLSVPDYCAGVPGTPSTYVEPQFSWGGAGYIRGRVYFSLEDQTATKAGNCGGIWSLVPTQNLYIGQDIGTALRLENQNSYGTYNGYSPVIIARQNQVSGPPLFWSPWVSSVSSPSYGIDYTSLSTSATSVAVIETDIIPSGTFLEKKTDSNIEYKLATPLLTGESVGIQYRTNLTDAWASCGTAITETNQPSGYFRANFQKTQWVQLRITLTPQTGSTGSFVRLSELRIR